MTGANLKSDVRTRAMAVILFALLASPVAIAQKQVKLFDLEGRAFDPLAARKAKAAVFIFVRHDCPISNRYAPEVQRLIQEFRPKGIEFFLVYSDPSSTIEQIRRHLKDYDYQTTALRDPEHSFVNLTGVTVTPEAVVFSPGKMVYRGRIDDRYIALGTVRSSPTIHDLADTLGTLLGGTEPVFRTTPAIGCYISDLRRDAK